MNNSNATTNRSLLHNSPSVRAMLVGATLVALAATGCSDQVAEAQPNVLAPERRLPDMGKADTRTLVPPASPRGLVRAPYLIEAGGGHRAEQGFIDAGSWAAEGIVRYLNIAASRDDDRGDAHLTEFTLMVVGPDYEPVTADDRPFQDLADFIRRAKPTATQLGQLLREVREAPADELPGRSHVWNVVDGVVFTPSEARASLALANGCDSTILAQRVGLRNRAIAELGDARPVADLTVLAEVPQMGAVALHRLRYAAHTLHCPAAGDAMLRSTAYQTLRLIYTPAHLRQAVHEAQRVSQGAENPEEAFDAALEATLADPFVEMAPTVADVDDEDAMLQAAAEHLVAHLVNLLSEEPIGRWTLLVQRKRDELDADLRRLRRGGWEMWEHDGAWVAVGRVWGVYCEVLFPLDAPERVVVRVEFD